MKKYFNLKLRAPISMKHHTWNTREILISQVDDVFVEVAPFPGLHDFTLKEIDEKHEFFQLCFEIAKFLKEKSLADKVNLNSLLIDECLETSSPVAKLKCGRKAIAQEIDLVLRLIDENPQIKLRIDANQAWSNSEFLDFAKKIPTKNIDYFEEPVVDSYLLKDEFPIALDESIYQNPNYDFQHETLIVKPKLFKTFDILISFLERHRTKRLIFSSLFESSIGMRELMQFALLYNKNDFHGLDPFNFLLEDTVDNPLVFANGAIHDHQESFDVRS